MEEKKLITFIDNVSRTIIGKLAGETNDYIEIENPVVVHTVPQQDPQSGQMRMTLQLFPIFFREFLADKDTPIVWKYKKVNITQPTEDVTFDFKLHAQYENLFAPTDNVVAMPQAPGVPSNVPEPIKLFDN